MKEMDAETNQSYFLLVCSIITQETFFPGPRFGNFERNIISKRLNRILADDKLMVSQRVKFSFKD